MTAVIEKVTGYVTRNSDSGAPELLVFQPVDVGVQVPAGTVEPGEDIDAAALREVMEETGLTGLRPVRFLGSIEVPLTDESRAPLQDTVIRHSPGLEYGIGIYVPRAYWLRVVDRLDDYAKVEVPGHNGWLRAAALADRMDRYFYHFEATGPTPQRWQIQDEGHPPWECFWVPLSPRPELDHEPQAWKDEYYDKLLASIG
ncbi:MAG: NUDIX domain-containing protein [Candidatus Latescibacteria bacterium]|nr:NUDIX domain-containing protein [Candidatus Latescibacterota bacterium]